MLYLAAALVLNAPDGNFVSTHRTLSLLLKKGAGKNLIQKNLFRIVVCPSLRCGKVVWMGVEQCAVQGGVK